MSGMPRILVVRGGAIGDFITTLPAIAALRRQWPNGRLELLGYPHIIELAHGRGYADAVRSIEAQAMAGFFVPNNELNAGLREYFGGFHLVVSYLYDPDHVFADNVRRAGARQVIEASPRPVDLPATEYFCQPLQQLAIYPEDFTPRVHPNEADHAVARQFLAGAGHRPLVAIHPGSGSTSKNWPAAKFGAVARWLVDELNTDLVVVRGEADDAVATAFLEALQGRPARLARGLPLPALGAVLARCALYLGNDSGITHLAAAVGTRTVALFGPASSSVWHPRGDQVRVVPFGHEDVHEVCRVIVEWWSRGPT